MALWLPKWLRQDTAPEPEDVHRRYFIFAGAAAAAAALLPYDQLFAGLDPARLLNDPNPLLVTTDNGVLGYYRQRFLHATVRIDRKTLMETIHQPGAWSKVCREETERALYEVYREAARNGITLMPADTDYYAEAVEAAVARAEGDPHGWPGREHVVPISVSEAVGRFVNPDGTPMREVRVPIDWREGMQWTEED